ncbi:MAG: helix-turn-helix domain-containing protein [Candidatus Hydrothermarchaeales archaeon]
MVKELKVKVPEIEDFDAALVNVLKFFLDTESKAKIYLYLRKNGKSTSREIAKGANLYPSSAREALIEMTKTGITKREKLKKEGVGKNPYIYEAISPIELTKKKIDKIEKRLNKLINIDTYLKGDKEVKPPGVPVRIRIERIEDEEGNVNIKVEKETATGDKIKEE